MTPEEYEARQLYEQLQPGDRVEVIHGVTVGSSATWSSGSSFASLQAFVSQCLAVTASRSASSVGAVTDAVGSRGTVGHRVRLLGADRQSQRKRRSPQQP